MYYIQSSSYYSHDRECYGRSWFLCNLPKSVAPWVYFVIFALLTITEYVVRDYSGPDGALSVLRISMGSVLFFFMMTILSLGVSLRDDDDELAVIHTGLWPYKVAVWALLVGTTFLYPENVFTVYQYIARVFGAIFLVVQTIIFIDTVFKLNEWVLDRESSAWNAFLIACTAILMCVSVGGLLSLYYFYVPYGSCAMNIGFITSTVALGLGYSLISISPWRIQQAGLFTSSIVFVLNAFYTWGALNSQPSNECTCRISPETDSQSDLALKIIAFLITIVSMLIGTVNTARSSEALSITPDHGLNYDGTLYRVDVFYCIYMLASGYVAMILLAWDVATTDDDTEFSLEKGIGSTWARMGVCWFTGCLYLWTLIAHQVLGSCRTFEF